MAKSMQNLIHRTAGFLNEDVLKIPNRRFVPDCLYQRVVSGNNLQLLGCRHTKLQGSSIAFDPEQCLKAAMGEFVERYAAANYRSEEWAIGSMDGLGNGHRFLPLDCYRYYNQAQYQRLQAYGIKPLDREDIIAWTHARDYLSGETYTVPAFSIYLPYENDRCREATFMVGSTSTGIAAGASTQDALISGFCECAERHAFAQFWYRQEHVSYKQYTSALIRRYYKGDKRVQQLFGNPHVAMKAFDLSPFSPIETMVVFLYFTYKGRLYQSLGCAARFSKRDALVKAALEAYQGVEYAISLMDKQRLPEKMDLSNIHDFDAHFHFYNQYPDCRKSSKILREAQDWEHGDDNIFQDEKKIGQKFCIEDLRAMGLSYLLYKDITPIDVAAIPYRVLRVVTPSWALLTGQHEWPFLGQVFGEDEDLFLTYPHPFP